MRNITPRRPTQTAAPGTQVLAQRRPDPTTDFPAGIHNPLLRSVSLINDDHPIELGVGQDGAECGSDIGTVRHGDALPAVSLSTVKVSLPDGYRLVAIHAEVTSPETQNSFNNSDAVTSALPQHYSPGAIATAGLPHDANYVSGGDPTAVRWHSQPLTCEACLGSKRHAHFGQRVCSYCAGTGRGADLGMGAL